MRGALDIYAKSGVLYRKLWQWNGRKALMKKGMTSLTALLLTLLLALGGVAFFGWQPGIAVAFRRRSDHL